MVTSQTAIHFIFSRTDAQKAKKIVDELNTSLDFDTEIEDNIAWVAAVGNGSTIKKALPDECLRLWPKPELMSSKLCWELQKLRLFRIQRKLAEKAAQIIHQELFHQTKTE